MSQEHTTDGQQLSFGMQGEDIAALHELITTIGIEIDEAELEERRFGVTTREALRRLQLLAGAEPTGEVDQQVFGLLRGALERLQANLTERGVTEDVQSDEYYIEGTVTDPDG